MFPQIILGQKAKSENEYINFLTNEIQKNIKIINEKGNKEEKETLARILKENERKEKDNLGEVLSLLNSVLKNTLSILMNIDSRERKEKDIEEYTVKINRNK